MGAYFDHYTKKARDPNTAALLALTYRDRWKSLGTGRVLDIACGAGMLAGQAPEGAKVFGIDRDSAAAAHVRVRCAVASATELPFPHASFDAVHCAHLIEHLHSPERLVREIRRVLRPGGLAMILTPDIRRYGFDFWVDHTHVRPFTPEGLTGLLTMNNFVDIRMEYGLFHETRLERCWRAILRPSHETVYALRKRIGRRYAGELICTARTPAAP